VYINNFTLINNLDMYSVNILLTFSMSSVNILLTFSMSDVKFRFFDILFIIIKTYYKFVQYLLYNVIGLNI